MNKENGGHKDRWIYDQKDREMERRSDGQLDGQKDNNTA